MTIALILKQNSRDVITVGSDEILQDVAGLLDKERIGAVVACDSPGSVCGVLSERDIVRQMARHGAPALRMKVGDAMTREVVTATPDMTIDSAMNLMTDRRIRHLPVVKSEKLVGVVSIGDLVKAKIAVTEAETEMMKSYITG